MKGVSPFLFAWFHVWLLVFAKEDGTTSNVSCRVKGESKGWAVNPIRLLSPFVNTAKAVAPASVRRNIDLFEELFKVKGAEWSIFHQRVVLDHCILRLRDQPFPALSIGRLDVHWDSLITPTIDIEVDDVVINVEFTNMSLSRSNWDELNEGIAPLVSSYESTCRWFGWDKSSDENDDFLQFNSISLLGNLTLSLRSRPLGKELASLSLKMSIGDLSDKIKRLAEKNFQMHGRRGCTPVELTTVLKQYFASRLRSLLKEIARDPQRAIDQKENLVQKAQALISRCKVEVSSYVAESLRLQLGKRIETLFFQSQGCNSGIVRPIPDWPTSNT